MDYCCRCCHPVASSSTLHGWPDKPDLFNPNTYATSVPYRPPVYRRPVGPTRAGSHTPQLITHPFHPSMRPASIALHAGVALSFTSSDGRLSVSLPATAVTSDALEHAGGVLTLRIDQVASGSGSLAGGSGHVWLGMYFIQLVDAQGYVLPMTTLHAPLTLRLHTTAGDEALISRMYS